MWLLPLLGFAGGVVLGLAARIARFCTLSSFEDIIFGDNSLRLRLWGLAIAVAVLGVSFLGLSGHFDSGTSFYLTNPVPLASAAFGGVMFGLGMALVGTCGYGALARLGGGDLSGLVVFLVIGLTGYIASSGFLAAPRIAMFPPLESAPEEAGIAHYLAGLAGISPNVIAILIGLALAAWCLSQRELRQNRKALIWGALVGLVIAGGWAVTSWGYDASFGETAIRSYSFVRPLGDTMLWLMTSSSGDPVRFGVGGVLGVIAGAAAGALWLREFRWEACDDAPTLKRQILGAAMMGIGGVFAMGCTVGQGLSAASVLAISAPVTLLGMFIGAWFGLQWLVRGSIREALTELFRR